MEMDEHRGMTEEKMRSFIRKNLEDTIDKHLIFNLDGIGMILSSYMNALNPDDDDEESTQKRELRGQIYDEATDYYTSLFEYGMKEVGDKPLLPFYVATAYFLCVLQAEMSNNPQWKDFSKNAMDIKEAVEASMFGYISSDDDEINKGYG